MSNEQKVWVGEITFQQVNSFALGMSFPNVLDYPELMALRSEILAKRDSPEYKDSEELAKLRKKITN